VLKLGGAQVPSAGSSCQVPTRRSPRLSLSLFDKLDAGAGQIGCRSKKKKCLIFHFGSRKRVLNNSRGAAPVSLPPHVELQSIVGSWVCLGLEGMMEVVRTRQTQPQSDQSLLISPLPSPPSLRASGQRVGRRANQETRGLQTLPPRAQRPTTTPYSQPSENPGLEYRCRHPCPNPSARMKTRH